MPLTVNGVAFRVYLRSRPPRSWTGEPRPIQRPAGFTREMWRAELRARVAFQETTPSTWGVRIIEDALPAPFRHSTPHAVEVVA